MPTFVYRMPEDVPVEVRAAFEQRGVRLLSGDAVVLELGERPVVTRELDHGVIPLLRLLPLESVDGVPVADLSAPYSPKVQGPCSYLWLMPAPEKDEQAG